jgi:predicted nucleic acid-binding protein
VKLFNDEEERDIARAFTKHMIGQSSGYLAPSIVLYEALSAALHIELPFEQVSLLFEQLRQFGLSIEEPTREELTLAERIARSEAKGGGYPTLFDSIYHAMAIERGGTFVTADRRHADKAKQFGSLQLLSGWKPT